MKLPGELGPPRTGLDGAFHCWAPPQTPHTAHLGIEQPREAEPQPAIGAGPGHLPTVLLGICLLHVPPGQAEVNHLHGAARAVLHHRRGAEPDSPPSWSPRFQMPLPLQSPPQHTTTKHQPPTPKCCSTVSFPPKKNGREGDVGGAHRVLLLPPLSPHRRQPCPPLPSTQPT